MNRTFPVLVISFLFLQSCVKDRPSPDDFQFPNSSHTGIFIANEGAFGNNNSEISFLDLQNQVLYNTLYHQANQQSAGDVLQSMSFSGNQLLCVFNGSGKVKALHRFTLQLESESPALNSPRYLLEVQPAKAYVTSLYSSDLYILHLPDLHMQGKISLDRPASESMLLHQGKVYVCQWDTSSSVLYRIDPSTDQITDRINVKAKAPHDIVVDAQGHLWVLSGNKYKNTASVLTCLNPANDSVLYQYHFSPDDDIIRLQRNVQGDSLFFIKADFTGTSNTGGLYSMAVNDPLHVCSLLVKAPLASYFWNYFIHPETHHIYISDPKGFTQNSTLYEYDGAGKSLRQFEAGVGAGYFLYKP